MRSPKAGPTASSGVHSSGDNPGLWRELGAAVLSPPTGFNRLAFGARFRGVFPSRIPATFTRLRLGASKTDTTVGVGAVEWRPAAIEGR